MMVEGAGNTARTGLATAVLLYGPQDPPPDLPVIMQFLLDDLRAEGWRIERMWLGEQGAHAVFDGQDLVIARLDRDATAQRLQGTMRPVQTLGATQPDLLRARVARSLQGAAAGLSITVQFAAQCHGGCTGDLLRARMARLCLLPIVEAAPPTALMWEPSKLLLGTAEFQVAAVDLLLAIPDPDSALGTCNTPARSRPKERVRPVHPRLIRPRPHTRAQRVARSSAGRLFGPPGLRNTNPLPRPDRAVARIKQALRSDDPLALLPPAPGPARPARAYAVAVQWIVLLPYLIGSWLSYA